MTYNEFGDWCISRASDGCWPMHIAIMCCEEYSKVAQLSFFKRRKKLKENIPEAYQDIVDYINSYYNLGGAISGK